MTPAQGLAETASQSKCDRHVSLAGRADQSPGAKGGMALAPKQSEPSLCSLSLPC